jgi:hypothetical protein
MYTCQYIIDQAVKISMCLADSLNPNSAGLILRACAAELHTPFVVPLGIRGRLARLRSSRIASDLCRDSVLVVSDMTTAMRWPNPFARKRSM